MKKSWILTAAISGLSGLWAQQPYIGEIRVLGNSFCPNGWLELNGQILQIAEYETLFNLIGTTYGGDGQETFALPDVQNRMIVGRSNGNQGESGGTETVTLATSQIPSHSHGVVEITLKATTPVADSAKTANTNENYLGPAVSDAYVDQALAATPGLKGVHVTGEIGLNMQPAGGSQPISIIPPRLSMIHCMSVYGVFPQQN